MDQTTELAATARWVISACEMTSHNIANAQTVAFKKTLPVFGENGVLSGQRSFSQGTLQQTGEKLDFAIVGPGFFVVQLPDGTQAYTRVGHFTTDANGLIVTADGFRVVGMQPLPAGTQSITAGKDGTISYISANGASTFNIQLAVFAAPERLNVNSSGLFVESLAAGNPDIAQPSDNRGESLCQGYLEMSNVHVPEEMACLARLTSWKRNLLKALDLRYRSQD
jgi:flagellar basal body rod protein FlgG